MSQRTLASFSAAFLLASLLLSACGGRTGLPGDDNGTSGGGGVAPSCEAGTSVCDGTCCDGLCVSGACQPIEVVPDCERRTPSARPLAILRSADGTFHDLDLQSLAYWDGNVYFSSEGEVRRVSELGGAFETVGRPGGPVQHSSLIVRQNGAFVTWGEGVYQLDVGQPPKLLHTVPSGLRQAIAINRDGMYVAYNDADQIHSRIDAFLDTGPTGFSVGVEGRDPTIYGQSHTLWIATNMGVWSMAEDGTRTPLDLGLGVAPRSFGQAGEQVFAAADYPSFGLYAVADASVPRIDDVHAVTLATFGPTLVAYGAVGTGGSDGGIFELHPESGTAKRIADTDYSFDNGNASWGSAGLAVGPGQVFFIESCFQGSSSYGEYRLVSLPP